jgi:uncharacterized protein YdeI (YjbR/CyaY-like superfamily)
MGMTKDVETYFTDGCGRCPLGGTPDCKVHKWTEELNILRSIVLHSGLTEESKWGVPCYTFKGSNVLIISAFKEYCALSFFNGSLLEDAEGLLEKPGENTQAARLFKFTNTSQIETLENTLKKYIQEAVLLAEEGAKVTFKKTDAYPIPEEFEAVLNTNPSVKQAFEQLTPGRQKGYLLYFAQPKQSATRTNRIEKCIPKILQGKGFHDR